MITQHRRSHAQGPLVLGPGLHRLDFDFGFPAGVVADPQAVKCRLDGFDEEWHPTARGIRVILSSGTPDTTASWVIDDISLTRSGKPETNLWANGDFSQGERTDQIGGIPSGWKRGGSEPAITQ